MKTPTGKLAFAYNTIARMEKRIVELEKEREIFALEQQAKGVLEFAGHLLVNGCADVINEAESYANQALREQS